MAIRTRAVAAALLLVLAVCLQGSVAQRKACQKCTIPITWGPPVYACSTNYTTVQGVLCDAMGFSNYQCYIGHVLPKTDYMGFQYPGHCGCPNNCSMSQGAGQCTSSGCLCNPGWTGSDCSQVTCSSQKCSQHGVCKNVLGFDVCQCAPGFTLSDCSAKMVQLPAIVQTVVPDTQYANDKYGDNMPVFNQSVIGQIRISMDPNDLMWLLEPANRMSKTYMKADMWFYNGNITEVVKGIGFRTKGGISRSFAKKNWKVSFNAFEKGRTWYKLKKLLLRGDELDPSLARDLLSLSVSRSMNVPAQRSSYIQLDINGLNFGTYLIMENVDEQYLKSRLGTSKGALYKVFSKMDWHGPDPNTYKNLTAGAKLAYTPETDEAETMDGYRELTTLLAAINLSSNATFERDLSAVFDVDLFLRTLVMEVVTGNWDGIANGNNFYLFQNPNTGKWQYLRHDYDVSFGTMIQEFNTMNMYTWANATRGKLLITRVLSTPAFVRTYTKYMQQVLDAYFQPQGALQNRVSAIQQLITPAVRRDMWYGLDLTYSQTEFSLSYTQTIEHPSKLLFPPFTNATVLGISQFLNVRYNSLRQQIYTHEP